MVKHIIYPAIVWFGALIKGVKETSVLLGHGPNKVFLVPDSCRATERNSNSISPDITDDTIKITRTTLVSVIFRRFGRCFGLFDIEG